MKKVLLILLVFLFIATVSLSGAEMRQGFGVGAAIGAPFSIGAVGEYNFGVASAVASIGYSSPFIGFPGYFNIGLEGNYNLPFTLSTENNSFVLYPTVGGRLDLQFSSGAIVFNIGGVIGLNYLLESIPLKIFTKAIPHLVIGGVFAIGMKGEVGALYCF